jgi:hypothetical protein
MKSFKSFLAAVALSSAIFSGFNQLSHAALVDNANNSQSNNNSQYDIDDSAQDGINFLIGALTKYDGFSSFFGVRLGMDYVNNGFVVGVYGDAGYKKFWFDSIADTMTWNGKVCGSQYKKSEADGLIANFKEQELVDNRLSGGFGFAAGLRLGFMSNSGMLFLSGEFGASFEKDRDMLKSIAIKLGYDLEIGHFRVAIEGGIAHYIEYTFKIRGVDGDAATEEQKFEDGWSPVVVLTVGTSL